MERVLWYGPHAARERMRVARALATLPETTTALADGALTYSAVRELTRIATAETEAAWLAATRGMVANQIESLVANHRQGDRFEDPTTPDLRPRVVRLELPKEVYALRGRRAWLLQDSPMRAGACGPGTGRDLAELAPPARRTAVPFLQSSVRSAT